MGQWAPPDSTDIENIKMRVGLRLDAHCKASLVIVHEVAQHNLSKDNSFLGHNGQTWCTRLSLEKLVPASNTTGTLKLK